MPDLVEVRFRRMACGPDGEVYWLPWRELRIPLDRLQTLLDCANIHFSETPDRKLGGPRVIQPNGRR